MTDILLIDDNSEDMSQLVDLLKLRGYNTRHAKDRSELESAAREFRPDAIILDLMFPPGVGIPSDETDLGYRAGAYLFLQVGMPAFKSVPFLILTGVDPATYVFKKAIADLAELEGFRGYLRKLAEIDDLLSKLGDPKILKSKNINKGEVADDHRT